MSTSHDFLLRTIDVRQFGQPRAGAAFILQGARTALIETGTPRSARILVDALRGWHLDWIFVTHIHLDHAGGAGAVLRAHPEAQLLVHSRGIQHLMDPTKLVAGVRAANESLFPLYGEPVPVRPSQIRACADGDVFDLGHGIVLEAIESPGHAPHHICFYERHTGTLFVGDAAGYHDQSVRCPLTVPPRFSLQNGLDTLQRLAELRPSQIAYTHYGLTSGSMDPLSAYARALPKWLSRIDDLRHQHSEEGVVQIILQDYTPPGLSSVNEESVRMCVRGALRTLQSEAA